MEMYEAEGIQRMAEARECTPEEMHLTLARRFLE